MEYINQTGLPSVTDILSSWIDKRWFKDVHRERGGACHDAMAAHALFVPYFGKTFNPLWEPYIISGKEWFKENVKEVLLVEQRFEIDGDYCGQPDLVCTLHSGLTALVDWKTAVAQGKYWRFQLAAYQKLIEMNTDLIIDIRISVRLRREYDKSCLINIHKNHGYDLNIFDCAKAVYGELT